MKLTGKAALATGSSQGISSAISIRLAEAGAQVVINYRSYPEGAKGHCQLSFCDSPCQHLSGQYHEHQLQVPPISHRDYSSLCLTVLHLPNELPRH